MANASPDFIRVEKLTKRFGQNTVVDDVSFAFGKGEFISLLGPSGCGKTTILRMIAGFETPSSGTIAIEGDDITALPPNRRRLGMVFQSYALFPNLNVGDNIAFGLRIAGASREACRARVEEMLGLVGLPGYENRFPYEMSGGQQQRVALARAIAPKPRMLLLDEPLSALDAKIRVSLREEIRAIQRDLGITTLFVTHDQEEALSISDQILVLNAGRIEQGGVPQEIYNRPATRFVATFVGTLNTLEATVLDPVRRLVAVDGQELAVPRLPPNRGTGETIALTIRPEAISTASAPGRSATLDGVVSDVSFLGAVVRLRVSTGTNAIRLDCFNDQHMPPPGRDQPVTLHFNPGDLLVL